MSCLALAAITAEGILCEYVQDILRFGSVGEPVSYLSPYPFLTLLIPGHNVLRYVFLAYGSDTFLTVYSKNVLHGREASMLTTGPRHSVGRVTLSASRTHLGLCKVLERHVVGDACEDVLDCAARLRIVHVLGPWNIVLLHEVLDILEPRLSLGHELRHHYGLAYFGCHFAESCLHELRGVGVAEADALAVSAREHITSRHCRTVHIEGSLLCVPVCALYVQCMVSGYKRILIICRRHIAVGALELACCCLLPLVVEVRIYCVVGCNQEIHILRSCADHLACVLCAVELLLLVQLHACAKLCVVAVDGVVVLYISATHPATVRKELCLLVVAATDDSKRVEQQLQRPALRVPRHLVVRDDLCDCAFGALEAGVA